MLCILYETLVIIYDEKTCLEFELIVFVSRV